MLTWNSFGNVGAITTFIVIIVTIGLFLCRGSSAHFQRQDPPDMGGVGHHHDLRPEPPRTATVGVLHRRPGKQRAAPFDGESDAGRRNLLQRVEVHLEDGAGQSRRHDEVLLGRLAVRHGRKGEGLWPVTVTTRFGIMSCSRMTNHCREMFVCLLLFVVDDLKNVRRISERQAREDLV